MSKLEKKRNLLMLIIMAFSLIILVISFLFFKLSPISENQKQDMQQAAVSLVERNFDTVTYFKISELPYAEQYDASQYPDSTLPCSTTIFKDYNSLCEFVRSTYVPSTAEIILNTKVGDNLRYFEKDGVFCKTIAPTDESYDIDFSEYSVKLKNMKKDHSDIEVTLKTKSDSKEVTLNLSMTKKNGKWLLNDIIY